MIAASAQLVLTEALLGARQVFPAQSDPDTQPGQNGSGAEFGKSAPIALVIILILLVALILLIRSMNRHVTRMPESFDEPVATTTEPDGPSTDR